MCHCTYCLLYSCNVTVVVVVYIFIRQRCSGEEYRSPTILSTLTAYKSHFESHKTLDVNVCKCNSRRRHIKSSALNVASCVTYMVDLGNVTARLVTE